MKRHHGVKPFPTAAAASALLPVLVLAGLLLGPAATASAAVPVVRQAPAASTVLTPGELPSARTHSTAASSTSVSSPVRVTTADKKPKKKSKKKSGGFIKKLVIVAVVVVLLLVVVYGISRVLRRRSA
ncbi:hypothetical protein ABZ128_10690 [Streptomyces sp. NPDC006326]|uniref:hypothetical protein n=1 Tax=Streptomyces sp. NPDC006326 TaxID=3156752 RepID=UPI0033BEDE84